MTGSLLNLVNSHFRIILSKNFDSIKVFVAYITVPYPNRTLPYPIVLSYLLLEISMFN